ncbi:MAG: 50S ribosomal protein L35ae [Desulfobacteraceae bacterium]|nr:50S ribosomal protein L35ae [Desulfobacteraceae bacterium]
MSKVEREGLILSYRRGRMTQYSKMCLIRVLDVGPSDSKQMIGWKVGWPADDPKIYGKIVGIHGRKGTLKVKFKRGVPGHALSSKVKIIK